MELFNNDVDAAPALLGSLIATGNFGATIRHLSAMRVQEMRLALLKAGFSVTVTEPKHLFLSEMRDQIKAACAARSLPLTPETTQ
tara:strand:+ start:127 stop:381 length:255 start_codon:yes stop_codon:yes gene_type:complete